MQFKAFLVAGGAAMALAACGSAEEEAKPRKGKYKPEVELTVLEMPGITDEMKEAAKGQMKSSFAAQAGGERCLKGGKKSDWKEASKEISNGLGGKCETTKDNGTASTADLEVSCTSTVMGDVVISIQGEAQAESFETNILFDIKELPAPQSGAGKMGLKLSAERIGDC